jgi:hypothetical protein
MGGEDWDNGQDVVMNVAALRGHAMLLVSQPLPVESSHFQSHPDPPLFYKAHPASRCHAIYSPISALPSGTDFAVLQKAVFSGRLNAGRRRSNPCQSFILVTVSLLLSRGAPTWLVALEGSREYPAHENNTRQQSR